MIKKTILIVSLIVSEISFAELPNKWIEVNKNDYITIFVNPSRTKVVDKDKQILELWEKMLVNKPSAADTASKSGDEIISKDQFDCLNKSIKIKSSTVIRNNQSLGRKDNLQDSWVEVLPDSLGESELNQVCEYHFSIAAN